MNRKRAIILLLAAIVLASTVPGATAGADVTLDSFVGGIEVATLRFDASLVNTSLAIELPPGSTIVSSEFTMEGVGGAAAESSKLNFTNGKLTSNIWAYYNEGRGLYPLTVDPSNHQWTAINNREVVLLQNVDGQYWQLDTQDPGSGKPPGARPIQLYRFQPSTAGADNVTVSWSGFSLCAMNQTNLFHVEMWLYNHTDGEWVLANSYGSDNQTDTWLNYTFDLPSPFVGTNGSIDVAIVGINSEWAGPMLPAFDEGHLYSDFIEVDVKSSGGIQYPSDVSLIVDGVTVLTVPGEVTSAVTIDDTFGLSDGLQGILDEYSVSPDNVSLSFGFSVGGHTAGRLTVSDLLIVYTPIVNQAPTYEGPSEVHVKEDGGWQDALDLDTTFLDDYNSGELEFTVASVDDSAFPGSLLVTVGLGGNGNTSLRVRPNVDFFGGPINVTLLAVDAFDDGVNAVVSVLVDQVGDRPELEAEGTMDAAERAMFLHTVGVTDPDLPDDVLTFSDNSDYFDIDPSTGEINWTPTSSQIGEHRFQVTVTDRFGLKDTESYTINVRNSNDRPTIVSSLTMSGKQGEESSYVIRAEDPDVPFGDKLSYFAFADGVDIDVNPNSGQLIFTPGNAQVPAFEITIRVQDTIGSTDEEILIVTVVNVNDPPVFDEYGTLQYDQGDEVVHQLKASDPDLDIQLAQPEMLTFSGSGKTDLLPTPDGLISFTPDQSMVGTHQVTYTVTDRAGLKDVVTITWVIKDVNDAPDVTTELPTVIDEDAVFSIVMAATDADGDTITWADDTGMFDIDRTTGTINFTPEQSDVGSHVATLTASDGKGGSTTVRWEFTVANVNDAPVIARVLPESGTSYKEGKVITFDGQATDEDGDQLTFIWKKGEKVLGTGRNLDVDDLPVGKHTITLVVQDGKGGEVETTIQVEVTSSSTFSSSMMMGLLLVIVLVVVVGSVLYMRSRKEAHLQDLEQEPEDEVPEDKVDVSIESVHVLEYDTEGPTLEEVEGEGTEEEPIYHLEEAKEFRVSEGPKEEGGE